MNAPVRTRDRYSRESLIDRCERLSESAKHQAEDFARAGYPFSPTDAEERSRFYAALAEELRGVRR